MLITTSPALGCLYIFSNHDFAAVVFFFFLDTLLHFFSFADIDCFFLKHQTFGLLRKITDAPAKWAS